MQFRVNLYVKIVGTTYLPVQSKIADANGNYTFSGVPLGPSYLVCEQLPSGTPQGAWSQTIPIVQTKPCGTVPINKPAGWAFPFTASVTGKNFGNVQSVPLDPTAGCGNGNFSGTIVTAGFEYEARLTTTYVQDGLPRDAHVSGRDRTCGNPPPAR